MQTQGIASGIISLIVGMVAFVFIFKSCSSDDSTDSTDGKYDNLLTKIDAGKAYSVSHEFVKAKLKSPSTADFPYYNDNFGTDLGDSTFMIISYFDAQNYFGAKVRHHYTCELRYTGGEWSSPANWQLINLVFR